MRPTSFIKQADWPRRTHVLSHNQHPNSQPLQPSKIGSPHLSKSLPFQPLETRPLHQSPFNLSNKRPLHGFTSLPFNVRHFWAC
jgi:hypothetical protein